MLQKFRVGPLQSGPALHLDDSSSIRNTQHFPENIYLQDRARWRAENVVTTPHPSMGSEDFAFYLQHKPGCFVRFGARKTGWEPLPLHSPAFDVDEEVLPIGAAFFDHVARSAQNFTWDVAA